MDSHIRHVQQIVPEADKIFSLLKCIKWYPFAARKGENSKRVLCYHNVEDLPVGQNIINWLEKLFKLNGIIIDVHGIFGNYYPDGNAVLPYHQDKYGTDVVSLSFGATRKFNFTSDWKGGVVKSFSLKHSDMIIFDKESNNTYYHGIPKQSVITEPRINLTCFVTFSGNSPFSATFAKIPDMNFEETSIARSTNVLHDEETSYISYEHLRRIMPGWVPLEGAISVSDSRGKEYIISNPQ